MSEALYHDPELVAFYDLDNGWAADSDYCLRLADGARSVLDLGCGTGLLAAALAPGRRVVGVDPAAAMLTVARGRANGEAVDWRVADARSLRLGERFDLVLMTGHAFQCFLTSADRLALLRTIALHLAPGGRFIFDSRNPAAREWQEWLPDQSRRSVAHPVHGDVTAWNDVAYDEATAIATYETVYEQPATGRRWQASARIAFASRREIETLLAAAGLRADRWLGSWHGEDWSADSPEIIPIGSARD